MRIIKKILPMLVAVVAVAAPITKPTNAVRESADDVHPHAREGLCGPVWDGTFIICNIKRAINATALRSADTQDEPSQPLPVTEKEPGSDTGHYSHCGTVWDGTLIWCKLKRIISRLTSSSTATEGEDIQPMPETANATASDTGHYSHCGTVWDGTLIWCKLKRAINTLASTSTHTKHEHVQPLPEIVNESHLETREGACGTYGDGVLIRCKRDVTDSNADNTTDVVQPPVAHPDASAASSDADSAFYNDLVKAATQVNTLTSTLQRHLDAAVDLMSEIEQAGMSGSMVADEHAHSHNAQSKQLLNANYGILPTYLKNLTNRLITQYRAIAKQTSATTDALTRMRRILSSTFIADNTPSPKLEQRLNPTLEEIQPALNPADTGNRHACTIHTKLAVSPETPPENVLSFMAEVVEQAVDAAVERCKLAHRASVAEGKLDKASKEVKKRLRAVVEGLAMGMF